MRILVAIACTICATALSGDVPYWDDECILFDASYGSRVRGSSKSAVLWKASSGWKVYRERRAPRERSTALTLSAARNEAEAVQLVVSPTRDLLEFTVDVGPLLGPASVILADCVDILRVRSVPVTLPTDRMGAEASWPDPLPPFREPITIEAGTNQALWVRVRVPEDAVPGEYTGEIRLRAAGYEADVPFHVTVYAFALPDDMTCKCAMGFIEDAVFEYQCISDPQQQREVVDRYFENFSAHHVSPYDFAPLDPYTVEWRVLGAEEGPYLSANDRALLQRNALTPEFDWAAWDRAFQRGVEEHHFSSYRLTSFPGLSHLRQFEEGSREYYLGFNAYFHAIESHLRERGWLDIAFIYNIDEPEPIDYPRVMKTFARLEEAAPDVKRFLTEEPVPALYGGPDIWCPLPRLFDPEVADQRRAAGEEFWWYVCTGPKAPYLGLFIDHPGTDMRVWLWQTWKYGISGVLIWRANRWTDSRLFPDQPQNPYTDPMSWTDRNGGKSPYGNGDGRLIYPPEEAADVSETPLIAGPVDSIRWELIRDGIEDYEYFVILEKLLEAKGDSISARKRRKFTALLEVPASITSEMTDYTKDPAPIETHRDRVARAIEELEQVGRE